MNWLLQLCNKLGIDFVLIRTGSGHLTRFRVRRVKWVGNQPFVRAVSNSCRLLPNGQLPSLGYIKDWWPITKHMHKYYLKK